MADTEGCEFCINYEFKNADCTHQGGVRTMGSLMDEWLGVGNSGDGVYLMDGNKLMFDNSYGEYAAAGVTISYCPFCGRYLLEDSNGER